MKAALPVGSKISGVRGVLSSRVVICSIVIACLSCAFPVRAQDRRTLAGHVPSAVQHAVAAGALPQDKTMRLAIGLPLRDPNGLKVFLQDIYDPKSPNFH